MRGRSQSTRLRPVREPVRVAEVEVVLRGQRDEQLVEDGEPADPRVEDGDRQGRALGRSCPVVRAAGHSEDRRREWSAQSPSAAAPLGQARAANARRDVRRPPRRAAPSRRAAPALARAAPATSRRIGAVRLATAVGADGGGCWRRLTRSQLDVDPVRRSVRARRLERRRLVVAGHDGAEAQLRRGDRQHPRAGAPVGERSARVPRVGELQQQLEAHPRGGMGAGPERLARVDHDVDRSPRAASQEGRTQSRPPTSRAAGGSPAIDRPSRRGSRSMLTATRPSPATASRSGSAGSSPGGP